MNRPISDINAFVRFKERRVTLDKAELRYGSIPVTARGSVEPDEGYDLEAILPTVNLQDVQDTLEIKLPIDVTGDFQIQTQLSGPIDQPFVQGSVENLNEIFIDRLGLNTVATQFSLTPELFTLENFQIVPAVGGQIMATGEADIRDLSQPLLDVDFQTELPIDEITDVYGITNDFKSFFGAGLPIDLVASFFIKRDPYLGLALGTLNANGSIQGSLANPQANIQWQLSQGVFSGQGEIAFINNHLKLQNSQLRVGEGTIDLEADADFEQRDWQAAVNALQVPLGEIWPLLYGLLDGDFQVVGDLDNFSLTGTQATGRFHLIRNDSSEY